MINPLRNPSLQAQRHLLKEQIARLRIEFEDARDALDLAEARLRNLGKPTLSENEVRKLLGLGLPDTTRGPARLKPRRVSPPAAAR